MNSKIIDVKSYIQSVRERVKEKSQAIHLQYQIKPTLAVVLVGHNPASEAYVGQKIKACQYCQFESKTFRLKANTSESELIELIESLNCNDAIHGILVQLPLPQSIDETKIINAIDPKKDVDGFHYQNVGRLHSQQNQFVPCTPLGVIEILEHYLGDLSGQSAVVIGRSRIVGRPMAELLLQKNCTVSLLHSRTKLETFNLISQSADIVIAAVGIPRFIKSNHIKEGAVVIDVGINRIEEKGQSVLVGDVDFDDVISKVSAITQVPGGVGLLTVSYLLVNTIKATLLQNQIDDISI